MKKLLSLLLAGTILFSFAACGDDTEEKDDSKKNKFDAVEDNGDFGGENDGFDTAVNNSVPIGGYITFGSYEQDNDTSNGKEDIEWLVLDREDNRVLVISKYALDCKPYNEESFDATWETCTLRSWLNNEFINEAFTNSERKQIPTVAITTYSTPTYDTDTGCNTQDKVFLLTYIECYEHFDSEKERECQATDYAIAQGADISNYDGREKDCFWWLRNTTKSGFSASGVNCGGYLGDYVKDADDVAVRPVMWIEL